MTHTMTIEDAQIHLSEVINGLIPGDELILLSNGEPLAKLIREGQKFWPCQPGSAKEAYHWMSPDFDAPFDDLKEYMS